MSAPGGKAERVALSEVIGAISASVAESEMLTSGPVLTIAEAEVLVGRIVGAISAFLAERSRARVTVVAAVGEHTVH